MTGTSDEVPVGAFGVPIEFKGSGPSIDRAWRGLTTHVRRSFVEAGIAALRDEASRAVAAVYLNSSAPRCFRQRGGVVYLSLDAAAAARARALYREPTELARRLTRYIEATARKS
ncbi:MAG: hypothetical protein KatS3mg014_0380 [Actinomycetota bacterium]|nr:MAG: hypothetical protein KatS3mg014_0380 [Actinomycetota bacterium]